MSDSILLIVNNILCLFVLPVSTSVSLKSASGESIPSCIEGMTHAIYAFASRILTASTCSYSCGTGDGDHWRLGLPRAKTPRASSPLGRTLSVGLHPGVSDGYHPVFRALGDIRLPLLYCCGRVWIRSWWLRGTTISSSTLDDALAWE